MQDEQILIVEDDAIAQLTLAQYFRELGFPHSLAVNNGKDAIEVVKNEAVIMVFLDVRIMGEWDGIDTAQRIKNDQPDLPLVFLTANTDRGTMKRVRETRPHAVIHKPYDRRALSRVIGEALDRPVSVLPHPEEEAVPSLPSLELAEVGVSVTDTQGTLVSVNEEFCKIHRCTEGEAVGQPFTRYFPENIRSFALSLHREFIEGRTEEGSGTWTILDQYGSSGEANVRVHRVPIGENKFWKVSTFTDVRQQKENTEKLQEILKEKDAFAQEIHHRVKNNLNVISGLFYLQAEKIKDRPEVYSLFQESVSRVKAMSIIHEQLYRYEDYTTIDLSKYVPLLADNIQATFVSVERPVSLDINVAPIQLNVDQAVACGLIINEVMTNSFKYAFAETHDHPRISISASAVQRTTTLIMQDNGVGLPADFNPEKAETLGIQLIRTLSKQLGGALEIGNTTPTGTLVSLSFST